MCVTCDRGYSLDSTGCPFNLRGEHTAGRAGEDSWEVRACFLCRAGSRVNAVCCPSLSLSLSLLHSLSFLFRFSYLISVIIPISCVLKWSSKICLKGWVTGGQMIAQCISDDGCGQDFPLMDNWFRLFQINTSERKTDLRGFYIAGVLDWSALMFWQIHERTGRVQTRTSCPQYVAGFLTNFMDTFLGRCGVNGSFREGDRCPTNLD